MLSPIKAFKQNPILIIANILVILGALNWLGVAFSNTNYVAHVTGSYTRDLLIIIGLAGVYLAYKKVMWFVNTQTVEHMTSADSFIKAFNKHANAVQKREADSHKKKNMLIT